MQDHWEIPRIGKAISGLLAVVRSTSNVQIPSYGANPFPCSTVS